MGNIAGGATRSAARPARAPVGKRVGGFVYVHRDAVDLLGDDHAARVGEAAALIGDAAWNVAKVGAQQVSLLLYEDFDASAFPALLASHVVKAGSAGVSTADYRPRSNPPILHRKEVLLRPDDPRAPRFRAVTRQAESLGLFEESASIGTRRAWSDRLREKGFEVSGSALVRIGEAPVEVERHRTAIVRHDLSQPVSLMRRFGIIAEGVTVFDYGCGQGDDVAALRANGFDAYGWDPHHAPEGPRHSGDVVNLGFVVNVIEEPHERLETVKAAWGFARRALVVSAMPSNKIPTAGLKPFRDGFVTKRGTFQRYFAQEELRDLVASATGRRTMSLAPGIVAVFRDEDLEQEVAFRRRSRAQQIAERFVGRERPMRIRTKEASPPLMERLSAHLDVVRATALEFGRFPDATELPASTVEALAAARVSFDRAVSLCREPGFMIEMNEIAAARRDDLLVHFAMTLFPGVPKFTSLPRSLQRDVRTFFGNHAAVIADATKALFSAGDADASRAAMKAGVDAGLGGHKDGVFRFRPHALDRLPVPLRVMLGCAEVICPDLSDWNFIELNPPEKRVRAYRVDDTAKTLPRITDAAEVDLVRLRCRRMKPADTVLYLKASYMQADDPQREAQAAVDDRLLRTGVVNEDGKGPSAGDLAALLSGSRPSVPPNRGRDG